MSRYSVLINRKFKWCCIDYFTFLEKCHPITLEPTTPTMQFIMLQPYSKLIFPMRKVKTTSGRFCLYKYKINMGLITSLYTAKCVYIYSRLRDHVSCTRSKITGVLVHLLDIYPLNVKLKGGSCEKYSHHGFEFHRLNDFFELSFFPPGWGYTFSYFKKTRIGRTGLNYSGVFLPTWKRFAWHKIIKKSGKANCRFQ